MEMVRVVKVVSIVGSRYSMPQSQIIWSLRVALDLDSKAEKNSTAQYSFRTSDRSGGTLCVLSLAGQPLQERGWSARLVRAIYSAGLSIYISMGLRQPRERVKFGRRCLSEKATRCL